MAEKAPGKITVFAVACLATLGFYATFFLRNAGAVTEQIERIAEAGALPIVLSAASLAVITLLSGFWAVLNRPATTLAAFTMGLGAPAVIVAAGVDPGSPDAGGGASAARPELVQAGFVPAVLPDWLSDSLALAFAPVGVVRRYERREVEGDLAAAEAERRDAVAALARVEGEREALSKRMAKLQDSVGGAQSEVAALRKQLEEGQRGAAAEAERLNALVRRSQAAERKARSEAADLAKRLAGLDRRIGDLGKKNSSLDRQLDRCDAARSRAEKELAAERARRQKCEASRKPTVQ